MSSRKIWFGNTQHAQWAPCPAPGFTKAGERYSVSLKFENGGGDVVDSVAWQTVYEFDIPSGPADNYEGIEVYQRFAAGEYGSGLLRFVDPMFSDTNYFSPRFASPALIEQGWKNWGASEPSFSATSTNTYGYPARKATWTLTSGANTQSGSAYTFLVPPGYYLHLGATGSATGTAQLVYHAVGGSATAITLASDTSAPNYPATVSGSTTGAVVNVYQRRTSTASSTLTLTALRAVITTASSPTTGTRHLPGNGHEGLKFAGESPVPQEYVYGPTKLISMGGVRLEEVEPWR